MTALMHPHASEPSPEAKRAFLDKLLEVGNVTIACAKLGLPRPNVYYWKHRDDEFRRGWDIAMAIFQDQLTQDVIDTAMMLSLKQSLILLKTRLQALQAALDTLSDRFGDALHLGRGWRP